MFRIRRAFVWPWLLLALVLQVDAVVKSTVMTALMPAAASMPACDMEAMAGEAMPGMAAAPRHGPKRHKDDARQAHCPYCSAAAHAPLAATAPLLPPSCEVSFAAYRIATATGPRGPPTVRPRARDPPHPA